MEKQLNTENFDETVAHGVTLVDFWATWCGPCRMLAPVIEQIAQDYDGRVTVGKVDVDEQSELAMRFHIQSIPTVLLFKDGQLQHTLIGMREYAVYAEAIQKCE